MSVLAEIATAAGPSLAPYALAEPGPLRFDDALGLARLAERGDLPAVAELSDLISRSAEAHAEGRGDAAEALWDASAAVLRSAAR